MKILLLGEKSELLKSALNESGYDTTRHDTKLGIDVANEYASDFAISFGYRYIIRKDVLDIFGSRIINMHISLLPFNRGSNPNLWSFLEDTPKGVTIHQMTEKLDEGDILLQKEVKFADSDTLATSYNKLISAIVELFKDNMDNILRETIFPIPQMGGGAPILSEANIGMLT